MDNDAKFKKVLNSFYKDIKFRINYFDKDVLSEKNGNELIRQLLIDDKPAMISRFGATEMRCIDYFINNKAYSEKILYEIKALSGIYPSTTEIANRFCEFYLQCIKDIDALAVWQVRNEKKVINSYCPDARLIKLRGLEPYYFEKPWSEALANKRILVIHPFKLTILQQYNNREMLFNDKKVLPKFKSISAIKAIQSIAGEAPQFEDWFKAYEYMCNEIGKHEFDIAIVGAGAYGLPLASYIKRLGKKVVHMAGSTQILFGIKGKRWDSHKYISRLYNEYWVRPTLDERPPAFEKVEGGSYW